MTLLFHVAGDVEGLKAELDDGAAARSARGFDVASGAVVRSTVRSSRFLRSAIFFGGGFLAAFGCGGGGRPSAAPPSRGGRPPR